MDTERSLKDNIKMVLQVMLRRKTTSAVKIFIYLNRTEDFAENELHTQCARRRQHVIRAQSSQSKRLNFLT